MPPLQPEPPWWPELMAKPNYSFEKRKRDLAKKAKKEEKRLRKLEKGTSSENPESSENPAPAGQDIPAPPTVEI